MSKEKILEKSRKDNQNGDEYFKEIEKNAWAMGYGFGIITYFILEIISRYEIKEFDSTPSRIILMAMLFGDSGYLLIKKIQNKEMKSALISGIVALPILMLLIFNVYDFMTN